MNMQIYLDLWTHKYRQWLLWYQWKEHAPQDQLNVLSSVIKDNREQPIIVFCQLVLVTIIRHGGREERDKGPQGQEGEYTQILQASKHVRN